MRKKIFVMIISIFITLNCSLLETNKFTTVQQPQITPTVILSEITISPTILPTNTPQPSQTITPNRTATNISKAETAAAILTQTAQPMNDFVNYLINENFIPNSQGKISHIPDFWESWAQIDWYRWWYQLNNRKLKDFILNFDVEMNSDSNIANWDWAGCGIVFHALDKDNHYFLLLAQNATLLLKKEVNGASYVLKRTKQYSPNVPINKLQFGFVVSGIHVFGFVNNDLILDATDLTLNSKLSEGKLGFSVMSGTNKGSGTTCKMNNIYLWEPK